MDIKDWQIANEKRNRSLPKFDDWTLSDWGVALAGETGELCNLIKKKRRGDRIKDIEMAKELADIMSYCAIIAGKLDIDLDAACINKFNEVSDRFKSPYKIKHVTGKIFKDAD